MADPIKQTDIVFCGSCDDRFHAKQWILEGATCWWLVAYHALGKTFGSKDEAVRYATEHGLEVVFRGNGPTTKTWEQLKSENLALQSGGGQDALRDSYEKMLGLCAHLVQALKDRDVE
jgi:hypothetical protein